MYAQDYNRVYLEMEKAAFSNVGRLNEIGDSLLSTNNSVKHKARVYLEYANSAYYHGQYEKADSLYAIVVKHGHQAYERLDKNKALVRKAIIKMDVGDLEGATKELKGLIIKFKSEKDQYNRVDALNALGQIKFSQYQNDSGLYFYRKALDIAVSSKSDYQRAYVLNNIALFKLDEGLYDDALNDFEEALTYARRTERVRLCNALITNIGLIHMRNDDHLKAMEAFSELMESARHAEAPIALATAYTNIGTLYLDSSLYALSEKYYDSAVAQLLKIQNVPLLPKIYNALANVKLKLGQTDSALFYAHKGLEGAKKLRQLSDEMIAHTVITNSYDSLKQFDSALVHFRLVKDLSDSIRQLAKDEVVTEMQARYELKDKQTALIRAQSENQILKKEQEIERVEQEKLFYLIAGIIAFLLILIAVFYQRSLKRQREKFSQTLIQNIENERGRIAKDLHDDIGQTLSMLKNRAESTDSKAGDATLTNSLSKVIDQTREISRSLYPGYLKKISLKEALSELLIRIEKASDMVCTLDADTSKLNVNDDEKMHIYRIVQELTNNTIKHAKASALKLSIIEDEGEIKCVYRDNGVGSKQKAEYMGVGLMSMQERAKIIGGSITFSSSKPSGFKAVIKLPKRS
jgi:signal transduction histidine kinase/Tfp pilus assembly protein PilF